MIHTISIRVVNVARHYAAGILEKRMRHFGASGKMKFRNTIEKFSSGIAAREIGSQRKLFWRMQKYILASLSSDEFIV